MFGGVVINTRYVLAYEQNPDLVEDPYLSILSWFGHSMAIVVKQHMLILSTQYKNDIIIITITANHDLPARQIAK